MSVTRTCPVCGHTGTYATAPLANFHHGQHSCARHQRQAEIARRRSERARGGVQRDCRHTRTRHVHGTRVAYVKDQCRCSGCTAANAAVSRVAHRARAYGCWTPYVEAGPVRDHVHTLRGAGLGLRRIAALAEVSTSTLRALIKVRPDGTPATKKIRPDTARRVLTVQPERAAYSKIDATGTHRRLQALVAIGWSIPQLAAQLSRTPTHLRRSMITLHVTTRTAEQIRDLYEQLWNTQPPQTTSAERTSAATARNTAARNGWPPPLAWDDIDTDPDPGLQNPAGRETIPDEIDEIAVERAVSGDGIRLDQLTLAEQAEVVRRLTERGKSIRDIASQLYTTKRTVSRRRGAMQAA